MAVLRLFLRTHRMFFAVLMLIIFAAGLRIYQVDFGLPAMRHPDEWIARKDVHCFMQGDYIVRGFNHPVLLRNIAFFGLKSLDCLVSAPLRSDKKYATLALRWVSVIAGILTVLMLYFLGKEFLYPAFAFFGVLLYSVLPLTVFCSKYGTPDMLLALMFLVNLFLQIKLYKNRSKTLYFLNGLFLALAFFVKYNACFLFFSFCCAHILSVLKYSSSYKKIFDISSILYFLLGTLLGIGIGFPLFQIESWDDVFRSLSFEVTRLFRKPLPTSATAAVLNAPGARFFYMFHFRYSVVPATGIPLFICIICGLITVMFKRRGKYLVLLTGIVPYYFATELVTKVPVNSDRYILPILGLYVLCALIFCQTAYSFIKKRWCIRKKIVAIFMVILIVYPAYKTTRYLVDLEPDTRTIMKRWIVRNIPSGSTIFYHWSRKSLYPQLSYVDYTIIKPVVKEKVDYAEIKTKADMCWPVDLEMTFLRFPMIWGDIKLRIPTHFLKKICFSR